VVGAGLCVLAAAALRLPWWESARHVTILGSRSVRGAVEQWLGYEIAGSGRLAAVALLAALAVLAILIARVRRVTWATALAPMLVAAVGGRGRVRRDRLPHELGARRGMGRGARIDHRSVRCSRCGRRRVACTDIRSLGDLAGLALGLLVLVVPASRFGRSVAGRSSGPYLQLAELGDVPFRSGVRGLRASPYNLRLTVVAGQTAVATSDGLITVDQDGGAEVLARLPSEVSDQAAQSNPMLGVAGDRAVYWIGPGELAVTSVTPGTSLDVVVTNVAEASSVGVDGSVWLRAFDDEPGRLRRLDVAAVEGGQARDAFDLPVIEIDPPGNTSALGLLPVDGAALAAYSNPRGSNHVMRLSAGTDGP
jgi:hypothetical protein